MVVGMRPPAEGTAPRRADRFSATAEADPGRSIDVGVEGLGHRSGGFQVNVRDSGRFHDQLASANSVADVGS